MTTAHGIELAELVGPEQAQGASSPLKTAAPLSDLLRNVRVSLTVCVGSAEVAIGDLMEARAHQVLPLDRGVEQPVDVLLDGQVIARGTLVAVDGRFGVRITEAPRSAEDLAAASRKT